MVPKIGFACSFGMDHPPDRHWNVLVDLPGARMVVNFQLGVTGE